MPDKKKPNNNNKKDRPRHNCLEKGHPKARCPRKFCTACRQFGHAASISEVCFQRYYCGAEDHMKRQCPCLSREAKDLLQKLYRKRQQDSADIKRSSGTSSRMPAASKEAPAEDSRRPESKWQNPDYDHCFWGWEMFILFCSNRCLSRKMGGGARPTVNEPSPLEMLRAALTGLPHLGKIAETQYFDNWVKGLRPAENRTLKEFEKMLAKIRQERELRLKNASFRGCLQLLTAFMEARVSLGNTLSKPTSVPQNPFQAVHTESKEAASRKVAGSEVIKLK